MQIKSNALVKIIVPAVVIAGLAVGLSHKDGCSSGVRCHFEALRVLSGEPLCGFVRINPELIDRFNICIGRNSNDESLSLIFCLHHYSISY